MTSIQGTRKRISNYSFHVFREEAPTPAIQLNAVSQNVQEHTHLHLRFQIETREWMVSGHQECTVDTGMVYIMHDCSNQQAGLVLVIQHVLYRNRYT